MWSWAPPLSPSVAENEVRRSLPVLLLVFLTSFRERSGLAGRTLIVTLFVVDPASELAFSVIVYLPGEVNVCEGDTSLEEGELSPNDQR